MIPRLHDIDLDKIPGRNLPFTTEFKIKKIKEYFHNRADAWIRFSVHKNLHIICEAPVECAAIGGKKHDSDKTGFEVYSGNTTMNVPTGKGIFQPQCDCHAPFVSGIVLDPFFGSGTTGQVANRLGRDFVGIELNPNYVQIADSKTEVMRKHKKLDSFIELS